MAKTTAQERRAAAREHRRGSVKDDAPETTENDPADALRAAASAAIAGAAVGAARAFARRRQEDGPDEETAEVSQVEPDPDELSEPAAATEDDETDEEPTDEAPPEPLAAGDARRIVQRAREQLRDLHGADAESVSAIRRTANGWRVSLEVVEVHRIPESTDVLATYEVEVDGNGDLLTFERTTRYHRSEADRR